MLGSMDRALVDIGLRTLQMKMDAVPHATIAELIPIINATLTVGSLPKDGIIKNRNYFTYMLNRFISVFTLNKLFLQLRYHVPRSFLRDKGNTLVLFEEFGGNPSMVNFKTVTVGKACANAYEGNTLELSCQGGKAISEIRFASFGDPSGECGSYEKGTCEAAKSLSVVQAVSTFLRNNNCKLKSNSIFFKCFFFFSNE